MMFHSLFYRDLSYCYVTCILSWRTNLKGKANTTARYEADEGEALKNVDGSQSEIIKDSWLCVCQSVSCLPYVYVPFPVVTWGSFLSWAIYTCYTSIWFLEVRRTRHQCAWLYFALPKSLKNLSILSLSLPCPAPYPIPGIGTLFSVWCELHPLSTGALHVVRFLSLFGVNKNMQSTK